MDVDYQPIIEVLEFQVGAAPGVNDTECFFVLPNDDGEVEPTEDFFLRASSTDQEVHFTEDPRGDRARVEILDDSKEGRGREGRGMFNSLL